MPNKLLMRYNHFKKNINKITARGYMMYKLFELFGINWIDALDAATLDEIKSVLLEESKKAGISCFRIDNENIPIAFCRTDEKAIAYCIENINKIEQGVMYAHRSHETQYHKIASSRPSKYKEEIAIPRKTTKKHLKKMIRSRNRKKRFYR